MATTCELIAKTTLGSAASFIEFTSIPGTHDDLLVLASLRSSRNSGGDNVKLEFNGSTSNLSNRYLYGSGSSAASASSATAINGIICPDNFDTANTFGSARIYIPNYAGSTNKSVSAESVQETNATLSYIHIAAGLWANTAAITSLKLLPNTGPNFVTGSSVFLYGITKA